VVLIPLVGLVGLPAITPMLRTLATRYDVAWTPSAFGHFTGAVGGVRCLVGAAVWSAEARHSRCGCRCRGAECGAGRVVTVAIGEAACVWLAYQRRGLDAPIAEVRRAFAGGPKAGLQQAKTRARKPQQHA
jgi:hypothetical protein